ncbi:T-complex protein 1 subunit beta [Trifolium repens]|nr:T-complex protein 1 subunit beta [Trifolium repens]
MSFFPLDSVSHCETFVGDGTTSVVVLAGELLREAEKLVAAKIHPMTIIAGFRMAAECARNALVEKVVDKQRRYWYLYFILDVSCGGLDLMNIARTTLSSKVLSQDKEHFAKLAVDAVMRLKVNRSTNLESVQIIKKPGGSLIDSFFEEGFILDRKIGIGKPKRIENARILVANIAMDRNKVKILIVNIRKNKANGPVFVSTLCLKSETWLNGGFVTHSKSSLLYCLSTTEAAEMILSIDEIITCAPRRREDKMYNANSKYCKRTFQ